MSNAIRLSPATNFLHQSKPLCSWNDYSGFHKQLSNTISTTVYLVTNRCLCLRKIHVIGGQIKALTSHSEEGHLGSSPVAVELEPISSESQFDRVIAEAQQLEESVMIFWKASWCRKCIYLKPKLEKLAADYYPRIRFYSVDVNNVPHKLVVRAGVTKMPTIQLWKDSKKQAELIGGHKAYLVANEVREMIENEDSV